MNKLIHCEVLMSWCDGNYTYNFGEEDFDTIQEARKWSKFIIDTKPWKPNGVATPQPHDAKFSINMFVRYNGVTRQIWYNSTDEDVANKIAKLKQSDSKTS